MILTALQHDALFKKIYVKNSRVQRAHVWDGQIFLCFQLHGNELVAVRGILPGCQQCLNYCSVSSYLRQSKIYFFETDLIACSPVCILYPFFILNGHCGYTSTINDTLMINVIDKGEMTQSKNMVNFEKPRPNVTESKQQIDFIF